MSAQIQTPRYYTPEEYLALEREAEYKSEYVDGRIVAMAGAKFPHNRVNENLSIAVGKRLE